MENTSFSPQNYSSNEKIETPLLFYSNSNAYITRMLDNLKDMWERAQQPSNVTLESITGPYGYNQFPFPKEIGDKRRDKEPVSHSSFLT